MPTPRVRIFRTSGLVKQINFMKKLFSLDDKPNQTIFKQVSNKLNPAPVARIGKPDFLNDNIGLGKTFVTRRQIVLNRHFTEIISDVLLNSVGKEMTEMGVRITSIETKAWNKGVRIFYSTSKPFDEELHKDLCSMVAKLRKSVTERQLTGRAPPITFIYDTTVELDRDLKTLLDSKTPAEVPESTALTETVGSNKIQKVQKKRTSEDPVLSSRRFVAPDDMSNLMLGLDHATYYNEVASKLLRGRGESSRIFNAKSVAPPAPLFTAPNESEEIDDARDRVIKMQRFLVNQRKKTEYMSKLRRKEEILHRDRYKWDRPAEDDSDNLDYNDYDLETTNNNIKI